MVKATIRPLIDILWWILVGNWIQFIYRHVTSTYFRSRLLPKFGTTAPQWFLDTWVLHYYWYSNLRDGVPNYIFAINYKIAARDRFSDWVNETASNVARFLTDAIYRLLGNIQHGFTKFSDWINTIWGRVGTYVPWWTSTLAAGLDYLRNKLPGAIADATSTWDDIWGSIRAAVKSWARARYNDAKTWVANTGPWLVSGYNTVRAWYDHSWGWLDDFRYNIYARITAWLGPPWYFLAGAWQELQNFYNSVWVPYRVTLHDFLADPLMWLYDRVEDELCRRW